jgi:DNA ligase D-like protein (predicted ligase)
MKKKNIFSELPDNILRLRKKSAQPAFINPMLATLTKDYFSDDNWVYEHKFDGERCLAFKKKGVITLKSRNNKIINDEYPELVEALEQQSADNFIIDGEIVSRNKKGVSDFELLQSRINVTKAAQGVTKTIPISYCIFDIMHVDGYDLRNVPLYARKEVLKKLLTYSTTLQYTQETRGNGIPFFKKACALHWEGLIAKRIDSAYVGVRSKDWLKFKCIMKQELVIAGYTSPQGSREYFGALLVGYYEKGTLRYAGKVGTGYSEETLAMLGKKLQKLETKKCPFENYDGSMKGIHWVKPVLVAEFQFAQWTSAHRLRVGRYKGLRNDKNAKDVVREVAKPIGPE